MSTKIYNGFRIAAGSTQASLAVLGHSQEAIQALVNQKMARVLAERLTTVADHFCLQRHTGLILSRDIPAPDRSLWWSVLEPLQDEQRECRASMQRSPLIDCDVELILYMHPGSGDLLGYLQEERVGVYDHLLSLEGVYNFQYWNNCDEPDDVSPEDWALRKHQWNEVLDDASVARFSMRWEPRLYERAPVEEALRQRSSLAERSRRLARSVITGEQVQAYYQANPQARESASFAGVSRVVRATDDALDTPGTELYAAAQAKQVQFQGYLVEDLVPHLTSRLEALPGLPDAVPL